MLKACTSAEASEGSMGGVGTAESLEFLERGRVVCEQKEVDTGLVHGLPSLVLWLIVGVSGKLVASSVPWAAGGIRVRVECICLLWLNGPAELDGCGCEILVKGLIPDCGCACGCFPFLLFPLGMS